MPYIATDLDAFDDADAVAGATGLSPPLVLGGLARTWRWCWRNKADRVTAEQLAGFFCATLPGLTGALTSFGFLEAMEVGVWRVRGVDRYLRLSEARRRGGLAAKSNLVPGARQRKKSLGTSPEDAQTLPGITPGSDSALSAKVEGRIAKEEETALSAGADLFPSAPLAPTFSERDLQALWNVHAARAGWARWDAMPETRRRPALARLREHPERGWWETVLLRAEKSAFLRGENDRGFRFNPDTLLRAGRAESVLEGKYDGGGHGGKVITTTPERKVQVL